MKRKYGRWQLADPDCKAIFGRFVIKVFNLSSAKPKIEYNVDDVPKEIKDAVKIWVKHQKYGGMPLVEYLLAMFNVVDYL
jgi:hypothetical protein